MEFLEKASSTFSGFAGDINQTLVEKDVFNLIYVILEHFPNSDMLNRTVFKILENIIKYGRQAVIDLESMKSKYKGLNKLSGQRKLSFGHSGINSVMIS